MKHFHELRVLHSTEDPTFEEGNGMPLEARREGSHHQIGGDLSIHDQSNCSTFSAILQTGNIRCCLATCLQCYLSLTYSCQELT